MVRWSYISTTVDNYIWLSRDKISLHCGIQYNFEQKMARSTWWVCCFSQVNKLFVKIWQGCQFIFTFSLISLAIKNQFFFLSCSLAHILCLVFRPCFSFVSFFVCFFVSINQQVILQARPWTCKLAQNLQLYFWLWNTTDFSLATSQLVGY